MRTQYAHAAMLRMVVVGLFATSAPALASAQTTTRISADSLKNALAVLRESSDSSWIPATATFAFGDSTVAANHRVSGPVSIAGGTLHVRGTIEGDAFTYGGDIVVHSGGEVRGSASAILGKVVLDGGVVDGDTRTLGGDLSRIQLPSGGVVRTPSSLTAHNLALAGGWLAVLVVVGLGVLIFASPNLDAVSDALERSFGRSFLAGIATELALAPALALLCVGLVLTVIGALLVPFAVVAYILAAAGLITLGYLAIARIAGRTVLGSNSEPGARRAASLRGLVYGLLILMIPWFVAGALAWTPGAALLVRMIAVAVTWVAATAGLGAAVVSRGGVRRAAAPAVQRALNTASWATPTPVSGVTAARRPTPYGSSAPK